MASDQDDRCREVALFWVDRTNKRLRDVQNRYNIPISDIRGGRVSVAHMAWRRYDGGSFIVDYYLPATGGEEWVIYQGQGVQYKNPVKTLEAIKKWCLPRYLSANRMLDQLQSQLEEVDNDRDLG